MSARFVRVLALLAGCALSGACATSRYTQSRVEAVARDVDGKAGSRVSIRIEGLRLGMEALDRVLEKESAPHLTLRLVIEPDELGYSFDPGQAVLRTADGREWRARGGQSLPVYSGASFDLAFGVAVEPGAPVELVLGGLARGTTRLEPVSFRLSRHRGRSIDRMYWLEAVGYAVAVPLALLSYPYGGM